MNKELIKREDDVQLTEKQEKFLIALANNADGDIRKAMNDAGYSRGTSTKEVVKALKEYILEIADSLLTGNSVKAVLGVVNVMDIPTQPGAKEKLAAAKALLEMNGLASKANQQSNTIQADTVFILPPKDQNKDIDNAD